MSRTFILTFALVLLTQTVLFASIDVQAASASDNIGKKLEDVLNSVIGSVTDFISKIISVTTDTFLAPFQAIITIYKN